MCPQRKGKAVIALRPQMRWVLLLFRLVLSLWPRAAVFQSIVSSLAFPAWPRYFAAAAYKLGMAGIWYQWLYLFATPFQQFFLVM